MTLDLHYIVNDAMLPLCKEYFLPSIPQGFKIIEHRVPIQTSGNFYEDNFRFILEERIRMIIHEIKRQPDDGIMFWSDVDVVFFVDIASEIERLIDGYDLVLQREHSWSNVANFGLQAIRRNEKMLALYSRLLDMQKTNHDGNIARFANAILHACEDIAWNFFPLSYSSESNGGCKVDSVLYHANCTAGDSLMKKQVQLKAASEKKEQLFEGFKCKKDGELFFKHFRGYETRNESTAKLIQLAVKKYSTADFDWTYVHTGDVEVPKSIMGHRVLCYATSTNDFTNVCPDFIFDHWRQTQLEDYETARLEMTCAGNNSSETNMMGWRGNATTHASRLNIIKYDDKIDFDCESIVWNRRDSNRLTCDNYVSLPDHARKWRYLIDLEGVGWSGRLKLLFFSKRVVFLQDRPFKEWYFPYLKPWKHFVPVRRDLKDLRENLNQIKNNRELEDEIRNSAFDFANTYLTRKAALERWSNLLMPMCLP